LKLSAQCGIDSTFIAHLDLTQINKRKAEYAKLQATSDVVESQNNSPAESAYLAQSVVSRICLPGERCPQRPRHIRSLGDLRDF
jgi:hypothetical protein